MADRGDFFLWIQIEKGKLEVAKSLLAQGLDLNMASKATSPPVDNFW